MAPLNGGASAGRAYIFIAIFLVAVFPPAYMIYWLLSDGPVASSAEEPKPAPVEEAAEEPAEEVERAPVMTPATPELLSGTLEAIWAGSPAEGVSFAEGRDRMRDALRTAFPGRPTNFQLLYSPAPNTAGFFTIKASDEKGTERIVMVRLLPRPKEDQQWKVDQVLVVGAQNQPDH